MPIPGFMIGSTLGAGAVLGGYAGHRYASGRQDFDTEDIWNFTGSSVAAGAGVAAAGLGAFALGVRPRHFTPAGKAAAGAMGALKRGIMWNPVGDAVKRGGIGAKIIKGLGIGEGGKAVRPSIKYGGAMAAIAAMSVAAIAMSPRDQVQRKAVAESNGMGGYEPVINGMTSREKMGILGATGDMVFGLNNTRHG